MTSPGMKEILTNAGAQYGLLLALIVVIVQFFAPQPAGFTIFLFLMGLQLVTGAIVTWRRTALPFSTASMATAGVILLLLAWLHWSGITPATLPPLWAAAVLVGLSVPGFLMWLDSKKYPDKWAEWRAFMEDKNAIAILLGRHIPNLRRGRDA
jgi:hypothetical protein